MRTVIAVLVTLAVAVPTTVYILRPREKPPQIVPAAPRFSSAIVAPESATLQPAPAVQQVEPDRSVTPSTRDSATQTIVPGRTVRPKRSADEYREIVHQTVDTIYARALWHIEHTPPELLAEKLDELSDELQRALTPLAEQAEADLTASEKANFGLENARLARNLENKLKLAIEKLAATRLPPVPVDAKTLIQQYASNELLADRFYKGRQLVVTGKVESVNKAIIGDDFYVMVSGESTHSWRSIQCSFPAERSNLAERLYPGDTVTVRGVCRGLFGNVRIEGDTISRP